MRTLQTEAQHGAPGRGSGVPIRGSMVELDMGLKRDAMDAIERAGKDFFKVLDENVDQSWLDYHDELPGNIYRIAAFGGLKAEGVRRASKNARIFGCVLVFIIQTCGPFFIFLNTAFSIGITPERRIMWEKWDPSLDDWKHIPTTKLISMIAISLFAVNALFYTLSEKDAWLGSMKIYRLQHHFGGKGIACLYVDAAVNCWVVLCCSLDACLSIGTAQSPKHVLFCCLALVFLFNLDDVDGNLDFVSDDDWPGGALGWMKFMIHKREADGYLESIHRSDGRVLILFDIVAVFVGIIAVVAPVLVAMTPTILIVQ